MLTTHSPASRTLLIGELSLSENAALAELAPESQLWRRAANLLEAQVILGEEPIERVLLAQARPGVLPCDTPQRVRDWAPEVQLLNVAGDWCEGELRTGRPWEGVVRVSWRDLLIARADAKPATPVNVLVAARDYDSGAAWVDSLSELGCTACWVRRDRIRPVATKPSLLLWDGDQLGGREAAALSVFCRAYRNVSVLAVFDYPRADMIAAAHAVGVHAVLGRPWSFEQAEQAIAKAQARGATKRQSLGAPAASVSKQVAA